MKSLTKLAKSSQKTIVISIHQPRSEIFKLLSESDGQMVLLSRGDVVYSGPVRSVLPWPLHKDLDIGGGGACRDGGGINLGMICSLSIPIITICALILLMIIVTLLDFIFRWLPYFVLCLPVPGLKGKK